MNESFNANYRMVGMNETIEYHSHEEYEIFFFHAGSCRYLIHNQIYDLEPGDILLMNGLTLHKPKVYLPEDYIRSVIQFSPYWIYNTLKTLGSEYLLDAFANKSHVLIRTNESKQSKQLEDVFKIINHVKHASAYDVLLKETELKVLLLQALIIIYKLATMNQVMFTKPKTYKEEYVENIATYIQEHYMDKLTLNKIAVTLNLSKSYVSHLFKDMTGFTVMEYVMGYRLTQAKYLLEMEPEKAIKDVAYESGFESASHFSRYFRSKVGVTAKDYRHRRRQL